MKLNWRSNQTGLPSSDWARSWYRVSAAVAFWRSWRSSSESPKPPRRQLASSSDQQLRQIAGLLTLLAVVALEHLVHGDPEALVQGRLLRDPEDPRELVPQRAGAVGVDVGGGQQHAIAAHRQEALERRLVASGDHARPPAHVALGVEQVVVERRAGEDLALVGGHGLTDPHVDVAQRVGDALAVAEPAEASAIDQRRDLQ